VFGPGLRFLGLAIALVPLFGGSLGAGGIDVKIPDGDGLRIGRSASGSVGADRVIMLRRYESRRFIVYGGPGGSTRSM
jgi:hypothetical protein